MGGGWGYLFLAPCVHSWSHITAHEVVPSFEEAQYDFKIHVIPFQLGKGKISGQTVVYL